MADKSNFTADEWKAILSSPMLAGMAVTLSDPNGLWGTMKESMASARALLETRSDPGASNLVKAILADMETSEGRTIAREGLKSELKGKTAAEIRQQVVAKLARVGEIIDAKGGAEAAAFKTWLKQVAERVAEASKEGGFLGFGGVKVSDAEKASISDVAKALKVG
jgi:hypothetical protein